MSDNLQENEFTTATLIGIGTGILMPENTGDGFGEIYRILEFMSGEEGLCTHQLPRIAEEVEPYILEQFPWLQGERRWWDNIHNPNWSDTELTTACDTWVKRLTDAHGATHFVHPMHQEDHQQIDPMTEAEMLVGKDKIVTVNLTDDKPNDIGDINWNPDND